MTNPGPYKFAHTIVIDADKTTQREGYYNTEGGALNGNYTDFDVGCMVSNDLGIKGYEYQAIIWLSAQKYFTNLR